MASDSAKILFIVPSYGATGWYRANVPGRALAERGHVCHLDTTVDPAIVWEYDLLVFTNPATEAALGVIQYAKSSGKRVIADVDDDPWHMSDANPHMGHWNEQERTLVEACLQQSDRLTTTNPFLADWLTKFNPSVMVLPNCLPGEHWSVTKSPHKKTVIGWLGGLTHYDDLLMVSEPVNQLLASRNDIELHLSIFEEHPFMPKEKVKILPVKMEVADYADLFTEIDIGIAPLVDNHFNRSKSDLKFLEYGAASVPCVASDISTYTRSIRHGENGFLASTGEQWAEHLTKLIEDASLRERIAVEARKTAEGRFIDKQIGLWEKAYGLPSST